ncbi:hypothetical protein J11TS1_36260 [Oceanobacillus sp. J11TS1]|nr:hypothetical protein J11TS1_36260 [Oceanobacillus sp. J11TS1]
MGYILGSIFCIWGVIVIANSIFKMNKIDLKAKSRFPANIFLN